MLQIASYTDIGGRSRNEDTVRYKQSDSDKLCLVMADGLGGHGGGDMASSAAADEILRLWSGRASDKELADSIQSANQKVLGMQTAQCVMKTTVAVLELEGNSAAWHTSEIRGSTTS